MLNPIRLVNDMFDTRALSDINLRTFADNHLIRLANNNPGSIYTPMITSTTGAYMAYFGVMTNEAVKEAISEGLTVDMNAARDAVVTKLSKQQALVIYLYGEGVGTYQQFFPQGMGEYHQAKLDNLTTIFERYQEAAITHLTANYLSEVNAITGLITAYRNARNAQVSAFVQTDTLRTGRRETRKVLTRQLTTNLLTLAIDFLENPDRFNDYYDASLLPITSGDNGDDEGSSEISGNVISLITNQPVVGAHVVLSNVEGSVDTYTDASGNFVLVITVDIATGAELRAEAANHSTSNRPITIQPGQNQVQDFQLGPIPMP